MIFLTNHPRISKGATLVESVIAVSVLAVAVPLVFAALAGASNKGASAQAETRSAWIVTACMEEIQASRDGRPQYFTATRMGQPIPPTGELWALAFAADGRTLGKISSSNYEKGLKKLSGEPVRYIAILHAVAEPRVSGTTPMLRTRISVEYPASAPAASRGQIDFNTRIP
jgi:type II secretory pathway pseudopilin PulG